MISCTTDKSLIIADDSDAVVLTVISDIPTRAYVEYGSFKVFLDLEGGVEHIVSLKTVESDLEHITVAIPRDRPQSIPLKSVVNASVGVKILQDQLQGLQMAMAEMSIMIVTMGGGETA